MSDFSLMLKNLEKWSRYPFFNINAESAGRGILYGAYSIVPPLFETDEANFTRNAADATANLTSSVSDQHVIPSWVYTVQAPAAATSISGKVLAGIAFDMFKVLVSDVKMNSI